MGGGMAISKCTGSGVFIVDLEAGADAEPEGDEETKPVKRKKIS